MPTGGTRLPEGTRELGTLVLPLLSPLLPRRVSGRLRWKAARPGGGKQQSSGGKAAKLKFAKQQMMVGARVLMGGRSGGDRLGWGSGAGPAAPEISKAKTSKAANRSLCVRQGGCGLGDRGGFGSGAGEVVGKTWRSGRVVNCTVGRCGRGGRCVFGGGVGEVVDDLDWGEGLRGRGGGGVGGGLFRAVALGACGGRIIGRFRIFDGFVEGGEGAELLGSLGKWRSGGVVKCTVGRGGVGVRCVVWGGVGARCAGKGGASRGEACEEGGYLAHAVEGGALAVFVGGRGVFGEALEGFEVLGGFVEEFEAGVGVALVHELPGLLDGFADFGAADVLKQ
jgi:hypothetical protein